MQGCLQIREFKETCGILFSYKQNQVKRKIFQKIKEIENFLLLYFRALKFLHVHSHIKLSVAFATFYPFYTILFYALIMKVSSVLL